VANWRGGDDSLSTDAEREVGFGQEIRLPVYICAAN